VAAPARDITLEVPNCRTVVSGDEDRLRQVIANVVGNALVHTDGDVPIAIRVTAENGTVVLEVDDRGHGMDSQVAERVTERFFRADPARSRHRGGSGLGLSIVDATVSAHGGSVDIDSETGRGTTVRLTMPATTEAP
jgi:two-component system OmpR family sensor kinase